MKNNKSLIISIVAVTLIAVLVSGGTYAYWTWITNTAQRTAVNFTVQGGRSDKYADLNGNGTTSVTKLKPSPCTNTTFAVVKTVPINWANFSTNNATVTATLSVTSFKFNYLPSSNRATAAATALASLKWAIKADSAASNASTSSPNTCETSAAASGDFSGLTIPSSGTVALSTTDTPVQLGSVSFTATANTTTEQTKTYYLYIWIDYNYAHQNVGSVNDDILQGLEFTVQWSGTMI